MTAIFSDGFESGDLSAWDASNGSPVVSGVAALLGSYGLEIDAVGDYVRDNFAEVSRLMVGFRIDPNSLSMSSGAKLAVLRADDGGVDVATILFTYDGANYEIQVRIYNDAGSFQTSSSYDITDAPHTVEVDFVFQDTVGSATLWIDGEEFTALSGVDCGTRAPDNVHFGRRSVLGTITGTFYLDDFHSNDDGGRIYGNVQSPRTMHQFRMRNA